MSIHILLIPNNMIPKTILPYFSRAIFIAVMTGIGNLKIVHDIGYVVITALQQYVKVLRHHGPGDGAMHFPALLEKYGIFKQNALPPIGITRYKIGAIFKIESPECFHIGIVGFLHES
jgi:hypothetical protein